MSHYLEVVRWDNTYNVIDMAKYRRRKTPAELVSEIDAALAEADIAMGRERALKRQIESIDPMDEIDRVLASLEPRDE